MPVAVAGTPTLYENGSATSVAVPVPAGVAAGELLVCAVAQLNGAAVFGAGTAGYTGGYTVGYTAGSGNTVPAGWTLAGNAESATNAIAVLYRYATSSEPVSYTIPMNPTAGPVTGRMVRLTGVDPTTPLDASTTGTTTSQTTLDLALPGLTTTVAGDDLWSAFSADTTSTAITVVPPATMTGLGVAATVGIKLGMAVEDRPTTGATGTRSWSISSSAGAMSLAKVGVLIGWRAAAVSTTTVSSSRSTLWQTAATVTATRATVWQVTAGSVYTSVLSSRSTTWAVLSSQSVSATRATTWQTYGSVTSRRATTWAVTAGVTTTTIVPMMKVGVYAPLGGFLGDLAGAEAITASYPLDDVGGVTLSYSPRAPRPALIGQPCELAVMLSTDTGRTWYEPLNSRFVYIADGLDPRNPADKYQIEARSYVWRLSKATVLPLLTSTSTDTNRPFLSASVGVILKTLLQEAQTRGALAGITHATFSTSTDSAGQPWSKRITIYYDYGLDYLTLLQNLADQGYADYAMQGRDLRVYNPDTALAVHRDTGTTPVTFRPGRDITEAPFRRTWEGLANYAYFQGDQGANYQYTNPAAVTPWGRQEQFIANGSVTDPGTMADLTQTQLSLGDDARIEYTYGLDFSRALQLPWWDYGVGDYVLSAVDQTSPPVSLRIRQLTLTNSAQNMLSGNVVLNDRFVEADIRAKRRVDGITNGAAGNANLPGDPPGQTDSVAPGKVTGLSATSVAYLGPGGYAQSQVTLTWAPVTTNVDGTAADDIDHYELFRRAYGTTTSSARQFGTTTDTTFDDSPYTPGTNWWFSVRAVDQTGNRGELSAETGIGMASDVTAPQAPSTPIVTARVGILSAYWDGNAATGTWPADFDHIEVHRSTVNNFTPTTATLVDVLYGEGTSVGTGLTYGTPYYYRFVAVDRSGLKSSPSTQAVGTPVRLVGSDVDDGAITYAQLGFKDPGNIIPDGSFETTTYRASMLATSDTAWSFTSADHSHGSWCASADGTVNTGTSRLLRLLQSAEVQQILATEKLFCRFAYNVTSGANGNVQLVVQWLMADGTSTFATLTTAVQNGTWQQIAQQVQAPAGVATFRIYMQLTSAATTGQYKVDAVEVRRTVGTSIIQDAAITNALIANLAVNSAKISDLDVGKLTAGQLNADVLIAARLQTATSGNRVEMSSTGIRMYRGTAVTGHWNPAVGQLRIYSTSDLSHTSSGHGFQIGDDNTYNLAFDNNEIMTRNNGTYATLFINREGGSIGLGGKQGGFAPDGSDLGVYPGDDDHRILINSSVELCNVRDGDYADPWAPLIVGPRYQPHMWFDSNEFGVSSGVAVATMYIQPPHQDGTNHGANTVFASNTLRMVRIADGNSGFGGYHNITSGVQFYQGEVRITNDNFNAYAPITANAFQVASERRVKKDVTAVDDPLSMVKSAKAFRYKYQTGEGDGWHYGPMWDDLPPDLQTVSADGSGVVNIASMAGVMWAAIQQLAESI